LLKVEAFKLAAIFVINSVVVKAKYEAKARTLKADAEAKACTLEVKAKAKTNDTNVGPRGQGLFSRTTSLLMSYELCVNYVIIVMWMRNNFIKCN